jgi:hypothetical protein
VNNEIKTIDYSDVTDLYKYTVNRGDTVNIKINTASPSYLFININKKIYTTYASLFNNVNNDGIIYRYVTGTTIYSGTEVDLSFLAELDRSDEYNFEYLITCVTSPPQPTPTPTPTPPAPTPTPAPFFNLYFQYQGITEFDNVYTMSSVNNRITFNDVVYSAGTYTYSADTIFDQVYLATLPNNTGDESFNIRNTITVINDLGGCVKRYRYGYTILINNVPVFAQFFGPITSTCFTGGISQNVDTFPVGISNGDNVLIKWSDSTLFEYPSTPTPTPSPTPFVTPTPTPTPIPSIIETGLARYWDYSYNSYPLTGITWYNISSLGSTYNGTLQGSPQLIPFTSGTPGFFTFNGTNQWVVSSAASSGSTSIDYTINTWIQVPTGATAQWYIVKNLTAGRAALKLGKSSLNKFTAYVQGSAGVTQTLFGTTTVNSSNWYYVTVRWDGNTLSLFVNGVKEGEVVNTGDSGLRSSTTPQWAFMKDDNNVYSAGKMSQVQIYHAYALSDAQVLSNYNAQKSIYGY